MIVHYVFDVMDFLLFESEDFSTVLALLDDPSLLASLHRHRFGVLALDLELAELLDAHLQAGVLSSSRISFLESLEAADSDL